MSEKQFGRYQIRKELGRGGMATVYLAHDPRFRRHVAIKVLPRQFNHDPMFRARFEREAQIVASLEHPAIVPVYDFGQEDDQSYLVMRYMPGKSLAERIHQGPMSLFAAAKVLRRIASALDEAHRLGLVHRDLKPDNILFDQRDNAYLSDFGIVKVTQATHTFTGQNMVGTPAYMSPEQARGTIELDGRSDVYSLGVILFEMLTGEIPFQADTPVGLAMKHISDPIPPLRNFNADLPPTVQDIIDRAMAKARIERYETAGELAKELIALVRATPAAGTNAGRKVSPQRAAPLPRQPTPKRPSPPPPRRPASASQRRPAAKKRRPTPAATDKGQGQKRPFLPQLQAIAPLWLWGLGVGLVLIGLLAWGLLANGGSGGSPTATPFTQTRAANNNVAAIVATTTEGAMAVPTATIAPSRTPQPTTTPTATPTRTSQPAATPRPATPTETAVVVIAETAVPQVRVIFSSASVRSGPGTRYNDFAYLLEGESVTVIARNDDGSWYNIALPDGGFGWISATVVEPIANTDPTNIIVAVTIPPVPTATPTPIPPTIPPEPSGSSSGGGSSSSGGSSGGGSDPTPKPVPTLVDP